MIISRTKDAYLNAPLSADEVTNLKRQQRKWAEAERKLSQLFLMVIIVIPLCIVGFIGSWADLGIGMLVGVLVYTTFKMQVPKWLDERYPCSVVIDGQEVVKPYCNGLSLMSVDGQNEEAIMLRLQLAKIGRPALRFEVSMIG